MGITGLLPYLKKYYQYKTTSIHLNELKNSIIAIDISIFLYNAKYSIILNKDNTDTLVDKLILLLKKLINKNIIPVLIFDGKRSILKKKENDNRNIKYNIQLDQYNILKQEVLNNNNYIYNIRKNIYRLFKKKNFCDYKTWNIISNITEYINYNNTIYPFMKKHSEIHKKYIKKYNAINSKPSYIEINNVLEFVKKCWIPYYICHNHEAELCCSYLQKNGLVKYISSRDTDTLFTGNNIITNMTTSRVKYDIMYKSNIMKSLNITINEKFIHYGMMFKNDILPKMDRNTRYFKSYILMDDHGKQKLINKHGLSTYQTAYNYFNPNESDFMNIKPLLSKLNIINKFFKKALIKLKKNDFYINEYTL